MTGSEAEPLGQPYGGHMALDQLRCGTARHTYLGVLICIASLPVTADQPAIACADASQTAVVLELFAKGPGPAPFQAAAKLAVPESVLLTGLGSPRAVGVAGSEFARIWESLTKWQNAVVLIAKAGHIFEIEGPILAGEPSKRSKFFNLSHGDRGLSGHLRPDLVSAIFAIDYPGNEGQMRGIVFLDSSGESVFSVYVPHPNEKDGPPSPANAQFEETRALIASLPRVCGQK
jgi:putative heme iron utilization protein